MVATAGLLPCPWAPTVTLLIPSLRSPRAEPIFLPSTSAARGPVLVPLVWTGLRGGGVIGEERGTLRGAGIIGRRCCGGMPRSPVLIGGDPGNSAGFLALPYLLTLLVRSLFGPGWTRGSGTVFAAPNLPPRGAVLEALVLALASVLP